MITRQIHLAGPAIPAFGDIVHKISKGIAQKSREIYFALYQTLEQGGDQQTLFQQYGSDYFDLVIVDECHRGSARASSQWRRILEHFDSAVQVGLTATPVRKEDGDTYEYFGNPVYEYSSCSVAATSCTRRLMISVSISSMSHN